MREFIIHIIVVAALVGIAYVTLRERRSNRSLKDDEACDDRYYNLKMLIRNCNNEFALCRLYNEAKEFFDNYSSRVDLQKLNRYWNHLEQMIDSKMDELQYHH